MQRFAVLSVVLLLSGGCGHLSVNAPVHWASVEAELEAAAEQAALARALATSGDFAGAAQAYRTALELIPSAELPCDLQARAELLADSILTAYHRLLSNMPDLPGETPAWAVVAEIDSTGGLGAYPPLGDPSGFDMPVVMNEKVARVIAYFTTKGRKPFTLWLARMGMYEGIIRRILREHGLPQDLIYLAMIESGFNTRAQSYARAVGPWQFIAGTARRYDLKITWWVDERRDIVKSTHAACRYLKDLYEQFGSWELAMAAYNCGEGKVERHINHHKTIDYWKLTRLPRQTRDYVPTFMGAMIIAKSPERFGFSVERLPPLEWDEVELEECTSLDVVARCTGATIEELELLNAELRRGCTPPDERYRLRVPKGTAERFLVEYAKIPPNQKVTWAHHRVTRGQTLSLIARQYGTTVEAIKEFNHLRSTHMIREGTDLIIPVPAGKGGSRSFTAEGSGQTTYLVRKGDTLARIAARFGVTVNDLAAWNGLRGHTIYEGQTLRVAPPTPSVSEEPRQERAHEPGMTYEVKPGETLGELARRFGVSQGAIKKANGLLSDRLFAGQTLWIPGAEMEVRLAQAPAVGGSSASVRSPSGSELPSTHVVERGETLSEIARRHGTTVKALQEANGLTGSVIYPGQRLRVPAGRGGGSETYTVRRGDSLSRIAASFGVSVEALREANNLRGTVIHPGQRLLIPRRQPQGEFAYTVRRGDSLSAIARRFGIAPEDLARWNNLSLGDPLYPGTTLSIRASATPAFPSIGG